MNNNTHMFVCPRCKETFSSDRDRVRSCPNCGSEVVRMPINVSEWRNMSDIQKSQYKTRYTSTFKPNGFYYTNPYATSFAWHMFSLYIRCPLSILEVFGNLLRYRFDFGYLIIFVTLVLFEINGFKKNKTALYAICAIDIIQFLYGMGTLLSPGGDGPGGLVLAIATGCEFVYYLRRSLLFTNDSDEYIQMETTRNKTAIENQAYQDDSFKDMKKIDFTPKIENEITDQHLVTKKPVYCKHCGAYLHENTIYCHRCGERV